MKNIILASLLIAGLSTSVAQAQQVQVDTIYVNKQQAWCSKEKAAMYAIVTSIPSVKKVSYYTMDGTLVETTCYNKYVKDISARIKEGESTLYYNDGSIKASTLYSKGKLHSVKAYYPNGKLQREDSYDKNGKLEKSLLYDESGKATKNKEPWERRAEFPGGNTAFRDAIKSTLKYPKDAFKAHVTGRVIMQFTINKEGQMVNPKFLRRLHPSLDKEAMRVIETIGKKYTWEPSISQGEKVNDKMVIPIVFNLQSPAFHKK